MKQTERIRLTIPADAAEALATYYRKRAATEGVRFRFNDAVREVFALGIERATAATETA
jgi:hypothetical protein